MDSHQHRIAPDRASGQPAESPAPWTRSRAARLTLTGAAACALLLGGTAIASAAHAGGGPAPTPSSSASSSANLQPSANPSDGTQQSTGPATGRTGSTKKPAPAPHRPHIDGTVTSVSAATVTVTDRDGFTRTIVTSSGTKYGDGLTAQLPAGSRIHAEGTVDANGTSLDATTITVMRPPHAPKAGPAGAGKAAPPGGTTAGKAPSAANGGAKTPPATPGGSATAPSGGNSTTPPPAQLPTGTSTDPATGAPNGS